MQIVEEAESSVQRSSAKSFNPGQRKQGSSRYGHLLTDEDVKLWYRQLKRGSEDTAENYLKRLGRFCGEHKVTPKSYLSLSKKGREDLLIKYIDCLSAATNPASGEPYAPSYVGTFVKAVQSWAKFCGKKLERVPKVHDQESTPTLRNERSFLQEELGKILYAPTTSLRVRASIILIGFAGARPGTQGNKHGTDGIVIGDLPDLEIVVSDAGSARKQKEVRFKKIPAQIIIRSGISKSRHEYFTFLYQEGCSILKEYLDKRIQSGEILNTESPLILSLPEDRERASHLNIDYKERDKFLSTPSISRSIRKALRKSGITMRPYVLRSYFDTQLMLAESKSLIIKDYRQFLMGHKGDIERRYTLSKHKLPEPVLQSLREAYAKASVYLETKINPENANLDKLYQFQANTKLMILKLAGFSEHQIKQRKYLELTSEEFFELINSKAEEKENMQEEEWERKVVSEEEAERLVGEGWEPFMSFSNGRVVVRRKPRMSASNNV